MEIAQRTEERAALIENAPTDLGMVLHALNQSEITASAEGGTGPGEQDARTAGSAIADWMAESTAVCISSSMELRRSGRLRVIVHSAVPTPSTTTGPSLLDSATVTPGVRRSPPSSRAGGAEPRSTDRPFQRLTRSCHCGDPL